MPREFSETDRKALTELGDYLKDPINSFVFTASNWWEALWLSTEVNHATVVFEAILSIHDALEKDFPREAIKDAFPVEAWKTDTVEIPRAWLQPLAEGWAKYRRAPPGTTLGEALSIEGGGAGKRPARERLLQLGKERRVSNRVIFTMASLVAANGKSSWENAYSIVAVEEDISIVTVRRASRKHRQATLESLKALGILKS